MSLIKRGGRVKTRARVHSAKKSYERRRKASKCRGLKAAQCRNRQSCKYAIGKKKIILQKNKIHKKSLINNIIK
jgi:hypothetical protein